MVKKAESILKMAPEFTLPLLIVHGEDDMIADPKGSKQFIETVHCLWNIWIVMFFSVQVVTRN